MAKIDYQDDHTLQSSCLRCEEWREYDFNGRVYRIDNPILLAYRPDGRTHRVVGSDGIVHCVPAPGYQGCVLRWKGRSAKAPVTF